MNVTFGRGSRSSALDSRTPHAGTAPVPTGSSTGGRAGLRPTALLADARMDWIWRTLLLGRAINYSKIIERLSIPDPGRAPGLRARARSVPVFDRGLYPSVSLCGPVTLRFRSRLTDAVRVDPLGAALCGRSSSTRGRSRLSRRARRSSAAWVRVGSGREPVISHTLKWLHLADN